MRTQRVCVTAYLAPTFPEKRQYIHVNSELTCTETGWLVENLCMRASVHGNNAKCASRVCVCSNERVVSDEHVGHEDVRHVGVDNEHRQAGSGPEATNEVQAVEPH